jgi:zinc protease
VQYLKPYVTAFSILSLLTTTLLTPALSQSGRTRPKVPQPSPTTSQPQPINVTAAAAVIKQEQAGTTSRFVLRNGMTIVISEHHAAPIAAAVAYFKGGAADEPWSMSGTAQLIERLIFRGTVLKPSDRAVTDLRALGASVEANSSYDGTRYSVFAPSDKIKDALAIQADMLQNPSLDAEAIRREIPLVIEDERRAGIRLEGGLAWPSDAFTARTLTTDAGDQALTLLKNFDDPAICSMARLFNIAFTAGANVTVDSLHSVTREQLVEFYRTHYRPENLIVSVAGDVSTFNTLVEIQQLYGEFGVDFRHVEQQNGKEADVTKPKAPFARASVPTSDNQKQPVTQEAASAEKSTTVKRSATTEQTKLLYAADRGDISQSIVSVGFRVPGFESRDCPTIEVLMAIAGQGRASRLSRSLIEGQMVVNRLEARYVALAGAGLFAIQTWFATDSREGSSIDKAESALFKELDRLRREIPTEGELARARTLLEKRFVDETSIYLGRAESLARVEPAGGGFRAALDYRARIRAVSGQDVQRVAARYLALGNTSIHEYEPFSAAARTFDADTFSKTVSAWAPGFGQPVEGAAQASDANSSLAVVPQGSERSPERQSILESVEPLPVKDFSTLNGPRAFVREDHAQQEVTVAILFQGGRLVEEATTSGVTELMLRSILYGTPRRTPSQVTQEMEQLGADVRIVVEPDFFGFIVSVLSRNADRALKLLRDMIEEPAFREDDVARARLGQIASIHDARDSSFARSRELLLQALFPGHSYSLPSHGREEIVAGLKPEKLGDWYARAIKRQLPLAIIVGDTDGSALVSSQIAEGFKRRDLDAAIQVRTPQPAALGEKTDRRRREHTTIAVGSAGPKAESGDLIAIQLIESAMNGEGGGLLRELRDKQSLIWMAGLEDERMFAVGGVIAAYTACRAENEQRVRGALLAEFERLARSGLTPDEVASARALAKTSRIARLQSQPQHALEYARAIFYRRQASDVDNFGEQASRVTAEDIKRIASTYFRVSALCAGVVRGTPQQPVTSPPKQN